MICRSIGILDNRFSMLGNLLIKNSKRCYQLLQHSLLLMINELIGNLKLNKKLNNSTKCSLLYFLISRFLVTVKKNGVIEDLKKKLLDFLKQEEDSEINVSNIVLAEVRNHSHVKILVSLLLRLLKKNCEILKIT